MKEKIAIIMAHSDDADIWAGGTLFNNYNIGGSALIHYFFCENKIRRKEAEKNAQKVNAKLSFGNNIKQISDLINNFNPSTIITHWENDTHFEHAFVFKRIMKIIPKLIIKSKLNLNLFSCDCYNSIGRNMLNIFCPTDYIDISSVWQKKLELISLHTSQPVKYLQNMIKRQNAIHGARTGIKFAEAFIQIPVLGILNKRSGKTLKGV